MFMIESFRVFCLAVLGFQASRRVSGGCEQLRAARCNVGVNCGSWQLGGSWLVLDRSTGILCFVSGVEAGLERLSCATVFLVC